MEIGGHVGVFEMVALHRLDLGSRAEGMASKGSRRSLGFCLWLAEDVWTEGGEVGLKFGGRLLI